MEIEPYQQALLEAIRRQDEAFGRRVQAEFDRFLRITKPGKVMLADFRKLHARFVHEGSSPEEARAATRAGIRMCGGLSHVTRSISDAMWVERGSVDAAVARELEERDWLGQLERMALP